MIFYYPFEEGSSTRPSDSYDEQQTLSNTLPVEGENEVVISIFWQDRLVPETTVSRLSFFPDYKNRFQCIRNEIAENWKARIKGFLFFDWSFNHISNNKLKIQVDPNLEDWLNQKVNIQQTILKPAKCADQFLR